MRIEAHKVYNEYIQDKQHIHMNATKWITLSEYVKWLGREGYCTVEESPKGWFIRLIHRDVQQVCSRAVSLQQHRCSRSTSARQRRLSMLDISETKPVLRLWWQVHVYSAACLLVAAYRVRALQEELEAERRKRKRAELAESKREERQIEAQAALARQVEAAHRGDSPEPEAAQRDGAAAELHEREKPLQLSFAASGAAAGEGEQASKAPRGALFERAQPSAQSESAKARTPADEEGARKRSKVEELMQAEKERRERSAAAAASVSTPVGGADTGPWLARDIAVKVMAEHLEGYYKKKGVVVAVVDGYVAEVEMMDSGDVLRIDQAELETVRA